MQVNRALLLHPSVLYLDTSEAARSQPGVACRGISTDTSRWMCQTKYILHTRSQSSVLSHCMSYRWAARDKYCLNFPSKNILKIIPISLLLASENQMFDNVENKHLFFPDRWEQAVPKELISAAELVRLVHNRGRPCIYSMKQLFWASLSHWSSPPSESMPAWAWPCLPHRPAPRSQGNKSDLESPAPIHLAGFIKLHCWEIMCHRDTKAVCHEPWPIFLIPCLCRHLLPLPRIFVFLLSFQSVSKEPLSLSHLLPCVIYNRPGRKCPFK